MTDAAPPWLITARILTGTDEAPGSLDNPTIMGWKNVIARQFPEMASYVQGYEHDSIPWCGYFAAYCLASNGVRPPFGASDTQRFLWAASYSGWGTKLDTPRLGCVCVFTRNGGGHVGFYESDVGDYIFVTGGNQSDTVSTTRMAKSQLTGYFWPPETVGRRDANPPAVVDVGAGQVTRFTNIYATTFAGASDPQESAYDGHLIKASEIGFSLPFRFPKPRLIRAFANGVSVVGPTLDRGPWNLRDDYWARGDRPRAESQHASRSYAENGRVPSNPAGIDLTPAAVRALGFNWSPTWSGRVDWEFADTIAPSQPVEPPVADPSPVTPAPPQRDVGHFIGSLLGQIDPQQAAEILGHVLTGVKTVAPKVKERLGPIDKLLGGSALVGSKTAIGVAAGGGLSILQSLGIIGTAAGAAFTPAGGILTAITIVWTLLGLIAKIERPVASDE